MIAKLEGFDAPLPAAPPDASPAAAAKVAVAGSPIPRRCKAWTRSW